MEKLLMVHQNFLIFQPCWFPLLKHLWFKEELNLAIVHQLLEVSPSKNCQCINIYELLYFMVLPQAIVKFTRLRCIVFQCACA